MLFLLLSSNPRRNEPERNLLPKVSSNNQLTMPNTSPAIGT
ncbi:hypothetical protein [Prochlorococcus sp. MIT 1327]